MNHVQVELLRAKDLIKEPRNWVRSTVFRVWCGNAVDAFGVDVSACADDAEAWDEYGALAAVGAGKSAERALTKALLERPENTHTASIAAFDRAIELAGKRGGR